MLLGRQSHLELSVVLHAATVHVYTAIDNPLATGYGWRVMDECQEKCRTPVYCTICGRRKKPRGRDSMDNGLCDHECEGYDKPPRAGHLWPSESLPGVEMFNEDDT